MPTRAAAVALALVVAACGGEVTTSSPSAPAAGADAALACTGDAPVCCGTDADGCSRIDGHAICTGGAWTCPAGEDPTKVCAGTCAHPVDSGADAAPDAMHDPGPMCGGPTPICCGTDANGCPRIDGYAYCEDAWICPQGDQPVAICSGICAAPTDAGGD